MDGKQSFIVFPCLWCFDVDLNGLLLVIGKRESDECRSWTEPCILKQLSSSSSCSKDDKQTDCSVICNLVEIQAKMNLNFALVSTFSIMEFGGSLVVDIWKYIVCGCYLSI